MRLYGHRDAEQCPEAELQRHHPADHPDGADHLDACPCRDGPPSADGLLGQERCAWDASDDVRRDGKADASPALRAWRQHRELRQGLNIVRDADAGKWADRAPAGQYGRPWWKAVAADAAEQAAAQGKPDADLSAAQSCGGQAERAADQATANARHPFARAWQRQASPVRASRSRRQVRLPLAEPELR